jgi:hypothetical protein
MKAFLVAAALSAGCNVVDTSGVHYDYYFDPQEFKQDLGNTMGTLPTAACKGVTPDPCAAAQSMVPAGTMVTCDTSANRCTASYELRLPQMINLSQAQTPLPSAVVEFAISRVDIKSIAYWAMQNTLTVDTPKIDLYVASASAKDEHDPSAVLLGTVAPLPAKSTSCADGTDTDSKIATASKGTKACDVQLTTDGQTALGNFAKNYKTPFQIIVHSILTATGGQPIPAGLIDLWVDPVVTFVIVKT